MMCNHQFQVVCNHTNSFFERPCLCTDYTRTLIRAPHYLIYCINCKVVRIIVPLPDIIITPTVAITSLLPEDFTPYSTKLTGLYGILVPIYFN